ncbi:MAG: hypothetical protein U0234_07375 [Sandaracinus sp.]
MRVGAWILLGALALAGCEGEAPRHHGRAAAHDERATHAAEPPSTTSEPPETDTPTDTAHAPTPRRPCTADGEATVLASAPGASVVAAAVDDHGTTLALVDADATHVVARVVGREPTASLELADAPALFALEAVATDRFVALTLGSCSIGGRASPCVHALAIDTGETLRALPARTIPLPAPIRTSRVLGASGTLYFAHSHQGAAPALERLSPGASELAVSTVPLGSGDPSLASEPTEILGIAASGGSFAVLWRRGASEDAASAVLLSTHIDEHQVAALHDALVVESMAWLAGSLSIVVSLEFARPSYLRMGADGEIRTEPAPLRVGEEPPAPFAGRRVSVVRGEPGAYAVQIRDAAGDDVGAAIALAPSVRRVDVARTGEGFAVASLEGAEGQPPSVAIRRITCPGGS